MNAEVRSAALHVGWKVNVLSGNMASVRYRAVLPMLALDGTDVRSRLFANALDSNLDGLDVLVIVKSFTPHDLRLAQLAAERGIRVVYDLCDNIFVGEYGRDGGGLTPAQMLSSMSEYLSCIVTTTPPLADAIRAHVPRVPVVVIPDGIETDALGKRIGQVLGEAKARERAERAKALQQRIRNVLHRIRVEGVRVLPALGLYAGRRVARAVLRRVRKVVQAPRPVERQAAPLSPSARRIVWFGNHGATHARFGMLDILEYRAALETLAKEQDIELLVVSNNREKYEESIRPLALPTRYIEWTRRAVDECLAQADAVIIPNTLDPFSLCKSANRTVLALAHGVPVVATMTPALQPLADAIHTGDPLQALRRILADPQAARAQAQAGYRHAEDLFGQAAVRSAWETVLHGLQAPDTVRPATEAPLVVVLHLVQDLDLALPILLEARKAGLEAEAWCSADLFGKSPRVLATLTREQIPYHVLPGPDGLRNFRFPESTRVLLTVAETNLGPHRIPRLLTEVANQQGLFTATLQHGFENVALTHEDQLHTCRNVNIAAKRIYTWGPADTLHPNVAPSVRERCVVVGCPKPASVPPARLDDLLPGDRPVVGIFENLHWHRYSEAYKKAFIDNVRALAAAFPGVFFLVKPHHAGLWLTKRYEGEPPAAANLRVADPQSPAWEHHTASALLGHMTAVITTPSTVALDAARLGLPVAVAAGDLSLDNYRPLPLLKTPREWQDFVAQAVEAAAREPLLGKSSRFVERVVVPGDAARRIVEDLQAAVHA